MNVFDIIGPIMIGPSSSHTAGAVRLGQIARKILGEDVVQARIELSGSFAGPIGGMVRIRPCWRGLWGSAPMIHGFAVPPSWRKRREFPSLSWRQSCQTHTPIRHASILRESAGKPPRLWGPRLGAVIFWSLRSTVSRSPSRPSAIRCWWSIGTGRGPLLRSPTTRPRRGLTLEIFSFPEPEKGEKPL